MDHDLGHQRYVDEDVEQQRAEAATYAAASAAALKIEAAKQRHADVALMKTKTGERLSGGRTASGSGRAGNGGEPSGPPSTHNHGGPFGTTSAVVGGGTGEEAPRVLGASRRVRSPPREASSYDGGGSPPGSPLFVSSSATSDDYGESGRPSRRVRSRT